MAGIKDTKIKSKTRRSYSIGCFGFSWKVSSKNLSEDVVKSMDNQKKNRFWSLSRLCKKKSAVKTVPVDTNSPKILHRINTEIVEVVALPDQAITTTPPKKQYENAQNIILESGVSIDSTKNNTWQKGLIRSRKKDAKRKSISQQGSPETGNTSRSTNNKVLSHSATFPSIQTAAMNTGESRINKRKSYNGSRETDGKWEPVVGISIIVVTLIIMIIWGKLCAILCTSAWLYFVPRLRKSVKYNKGGAGAITINGDFRSRIDLSSEEYKKKVVLQGLLRRNHRN